MNERIQLLALQAGDYVNEVYTPPVRSKTPGKIWEDGHMKKIPMLEKFAAQSLVEHDGELIFSKEKFAELILEQCLDILDDEDDGGHDGRSVRIAAIRIKKHFWG